MSEEAFVDLALGAEVISLLDTLLFVAPADVVARARRAYLAFQEVMIKYRAPNYDGTVLRDFYEARRDFVNGVRAKYELEALPDLAISRDTAGSDSGPSTATGR